MVSRSSRPALRPVESIVVPDARHGKLLVLRDTQGVTDSHAAIPPDLIPIVARFNGMATCEQIARDASKELGGDVPVDLVVKLADELDRGLFLEGPAFRAALARIEHDFASSSVREASHAGGAYSDDPLDLSRYLDERCLDAAARGDADHRSSNGNVHGTLTALIAPHIDPWRGAIGYGHAYGALKRALDQQPDVDTFVLFGTSHAPMEQPFALCRKTFATPLGDVPADTAAIDAIAARAPFDAYADQFNHKREHSLEFQVVFLRHLLGSARPFKIIPILAGLGEHQAHATDPARDAAVTTFLESVREIIEARPGRAVLVAGADMAHIGPRFGDARPKDHELTALDTIDRTSLAHAADADARGFWKDVVKDLGTRRVCGLAPIYSLLRALPNGASRSKGGLLHYEQTVDKDDGSVVSHAAMAFFRAI